MYNNCFVIGGINKQACYIPGISLRPLNKKDKKLLPLWSRSYEEVIKEIKRFVAAPYYTSDGEEIIDFPTVSLYLENAMYGDLYVFVIDIDTKHTTPFIERVVNAADFVTVSKNNGRHAYFGVKKDAELFDSINLLASSSAASFISKTGLIAGDGTKFDVFCDTPRFIYERGEEERVTIRFSNHLTDVALDRFGKEIMMIPDGSKHFTVSVDVEVSPQFFGWLCGLGKGAKITAPAPIAEKMREYVAWIAGMYEAPQKTEEEV
jgi:hypothetical protein